MSHSTGAVKFPDGLIMFYEYNGTVDLAEPQLYDTYEELRANWRNGSFTFCIDQVNHKHEDVIIASSYGGGFYWNGKACRECKRLTSPLTLDSLDYDSIDMKDDLPDWFPNRKDYVL